MANFIKQTKNTVIFSNQDKSYDPTWDEADFTWNEAEGTWEDPRAVFTKQQKNTVLFTNQNKN